MGYSEINLAAEFIKSKTKFSPRIGIILGSGLGDYGDSLGMSEYIEYKDIPGFPTSTVFGHKGRFIITEKLICMQGRFHYYEGYSMEKVTFPIRVMKLLGVETLIVTNAAGGINKSFSSGDLMLITDHINFMGTNPLIGKNMDEFGERFPDMSRAYSKELISLAKACAEKKGITLKEGIYTAFTGPSFETPAEIRMAAALGGDAAGMSTVPEVIVARHSKMSVLGISCITNPAAGVSKTPLSHAEVIENSNRVKDVFAELIKSIVENL